MSSDIYAAFDYSDNLVSFIPSFDHHPQYDDDFLRVVSASSSAGSPLEDLALHPFLPVPLQGCPPPQVQEPLVFPSYSAEEGSMQRSYSTNCMGTGSPDDSPLLGYDGGPGLIRRVYSTGDLQRRTESCSAVMVRAVAERYSAEERKERIEKYRAKRYLRNFNKTIKYACRKTLADSRPRIRGRFARKDDVISDTPDDAAAAAAPPPPPPPTHDHHPTEDGYINQFHEWENLFLPQNYY